MRRVSFYDAYKEWRNRARKYNLESIVSGAIGVLCEPSSDPISELGKAPWLTMLLVKWACQDRYAGRSHLPPISRAQLDDLRQRLWKFPERLDRGDRHTMPFELFMRQLIRPQLGFQRDFSHSFVREAALLAEEHVDHPLRKLFKEKTGFDVLAFIDLSLATCATIMKGNRAFTTAYLSSLQPVYTPEVMSSFLCAITRTFPELVAFCRSLPDANNKVASEYFEFPVLSRYPLFRDRNDIICWHPSVFYRGLESFVHSVLSEEGQEYMQRFSRMFERHVVREAKKVPARYIPEDRLRACVAPDTKVPDGLLSFPGYNVFVESKAGLFNESVMTVRTKDLFLHKTKALRSAVSQTWATSVSLRQQRRAPREVVDASTDYLLIITNRELGASKGTALASMYPEGTLDYPNAESERFLPRKHIYVLAIDDFERLTNVANSGQLDLPTFLASCVHDDQDPQTARQLFEQHLNARNVPRLFSHTVERAVDAGWSRLEGGLSS